ncbi:MAG: ThuA domain-containing protein [Lentimonas sp.]
MKAIANGALFFLSGLGCLTVASDQYKETRMRVLIVDGFSNHDWEATTQLIRDVLSADEHIQIDVATVPDQATEDWSNWLPEFSEYVVVVQNTNDINDKDKPSWPRAAQVAFEEYMFNGGGMLVFHSGNNAFPEWEEYNKMIGLGWRNKHFGKAIVIKDGEPVVIPAGEGSNTSHGRRIDALLTRIGEHPIHAGLPQQWLAADLEVYRYARGPAENLQVLSYAEDLKSKLSFPIEWTVQYGAGCIYNSTYGHYWHNLDEPPAGARCIAFRTLMPRAIHWLAKQPVSVEVPTNFPSAEAISLQGEGRLREFPTFILF